MLDDVMPGSSLGAPLAAETATVATIAAPAQTARILPFIPIRPSMTLGLPENSYNEPVDDYDALGSDLIVGLTGQSRACPHPRDPVEETHEAVRQQEHNQDHDQAEDDVLAMRR